MAYFKIEQPNQPPKWIKSIDRANCTLEFTTERTCDCFQQDSGFFADSELAYLKFHFTETYPELEYLSVDCSYGRETDGNTGAHAVLGQIQEIPIAPNEPQMEELLVDEDVEADLPWGDGINEEAPRPIYYRGAYVG